MAKNAKAIKPRDRTGRVGYLFPPTSPAEIPMYSYERPAYLFWNGYANALLLAGWTKEEIEETLRSKDMRWMLDDYSGQVEVLGARLAAAYHALSPASAETEE